MSKEIGYLSGDTFRFCFFHTQKNTLHISVNQLSIVPNSNIFTGNKPNFRVKSLLFAFHTESVTLSLRRPKRDLVQNWELSKSITTISPIFIKSEQTWDEKVKYSSYRLTQFPIWDKISFWPPQTQRDRFCMEGISQYPTRFHPPDWKNITTFQGYKYGYKIISLTSCVCFQWVKHIILYPYL